MESVVAGQTMGVVTFSYPPSSVLARMGQGAGPDSLVPYEVCYEIGGIDYSRDVLDSRMSSPAFTKIRAARRKVTGGVIEFAKGNNVVIRLDKPEEGGAAAEQLARALVVEPGVIHECYTARVEVDQIIHGSRTKLTRYRWGGGVGFWLAPEDSIRLRVRFAALRVRFYNDRVMVEDLPDSNKHALEFEVVKPSDGFWPPFKEVQPFFLDFQRAVVSADQVFEVGYAVEPASSIYTVDVYVRSDGKRSSPRMIVALVGPDMTMPEKRDVISDWPLTLGMSGDEGGAIDLGYPGGALVPAWAAERLYHLGGLFWGANGPNNSAYASGFNARAQADRGGSVE